MSLLRPTSRIINASRARLQIIPNARRSISSTPALRWGAPESHYDPPTGDLFGVKPGEKYENEGWEHVWFYGYYGVLAFGVIGYCYKPDTR